MKNLKKVSFTVSYTVELENVEVSDSTAAALQQVADAAAKLNTANDYGYNSNENRSISWYLDQRDYKPALAELSISNIEVEDITE